jgi:phage portal protein BeeE
MSGNFSIAAICRWFGVPLHKLSELAHATLNNIEHQAIEFLQDTISPIVEKIENEYETKCFTLPGEQDMELEFDMNAYQRADSPARSEVYRTMIQNGGMTPNEVRRRESMPVMEGGDRLFIQQNMMPLDMVDQVLLKQSAKPAPPPAKSLRIESQWKPLIKTI